MRKVTISPVNPVKVTISKTAPVQAAVVFPANNVEGFLTDDNGLVLTDDDDNVLLEG